MAIFEKNLKKKGDDIILDDYIPVDGTYVIVGLSCSSENVFCDSLIRTRVVLKCENTKTLSG